jgi:hypothetical protein
MKITGFFLILVVFVASCEKEDPAPDQLLENTNLEKYAGSGQPWFIAGEGSGFAAGWNAEDYSSPSHSLKIVRTSVPNPLDTEFWYWCQTITRNIPTGKKLTLSAKIKGVDLNGEGVAIAIRGDAGSNQVQFASTQYATIITGNFDWTTYTLELPAVESSVTTLLVFLIYLPNTTGIAYFDDIELTVN